MYMKRLLFLAALFLTGCPFNGMDADWKQDFYNETDHEIYVYIHIDDQRPAYGELPLDLLEKEPRALDRMRAQNQGFYTRAAGTKIDYGDLMHVYVFHPDTLAKYSWEEIVTQKKYWFQEVEHHHYDIYFPGDFEYMGAE